MSVDVATGTDRAEHTSGPDLKVAPQYLSATEIGYLVKGGSDEGPAFTSGTRVPVKRSQQVVFTTATSGIDQTLDVCTVRPDGNGLQVLTSSGANDDCDGQIVYNSGMYGSQ